MDHIEAFRPNQSTRIADKNKPGISAEMRNHELQGYLQPVIIEWEKN
jgi:hypothetical protein